MQMIKLFQLNLQTLVYITFSATFTENNACQTNFNTLASPSTSNLRLAYTLKKLIACIKLMFQEVLSNGSKTDFELLSESYFLSWWDCRFPITSIFRTVSSTFFQQYFVSNIHV